MSFARLSSLHQTDPAKPYSVEFAISIASSSLSKGCSVATGPNISSVAHLDDADRFSIRVGGT